MVFQAGSSWRIPAGSAGRNGGQQSWQSTAVFFTLAGALEVFLWHEEQLLWLESFPFISSVCRDASVRWQQHRENVNAFEKWFWMRYFVLGRCESLNPGVFKDDAKWGNQLQTEKVKYLALMSLSVHCYQKPQLMSWLKSALVCRVIVTGWSFCCLICLERWYLLFHPMQEVMRCSAVNTFGKESLWAELQMFWDIYWLLMTRVI